MSNDASRPPEEPREPEPPLVTSDDPTSSRDPEADVPLTDVVEVIQIVCWRCGLTTLEAVSCSHCAAVLIKEDASVTKNKSKKSNPQLLGMILAYVVFLMTSLVYAMVLHGSDHFTKADAELGMVIVEVIDLLITLSLFVFLGRQVVRRPSWRTRILTWLAAPIASVAAYFLVHAYMEAIRRYINLDWMYAGSDMKFDWFHILIIAVQPALVEELFFRYFAYGTLRKVTHVHSAVALSSLMFALAHLYNPLGLPFLFVMGVMLGYARAYSGGLLLPMLMHFGHNLTVLYLESLK